MKIRNREQVFLAILDPDFAVGILAFGAMTVTAAVVGNADMPAFVTTILVPAQRGCTTILDSPYYPLHIHVRPVSLNKGAAEAVDYLRQFMGRSQSFLYRRSNGLNRLVRLGLATCR
jgi:hypothetical protein